MSLASETEPKFDWNFSLNVYAKILKDEVYIMSRKEEINTFRQSGF